MIRFLCRPMLAMVTIALLIDHSQLKAEELAGEIIIVAEGDEKNESKDADDGDASYWIGIAGHSAEDGFVVDEVIPESPAAQAGLAKKDLILVVGEKKIAELEDLVAVIKNSEGNALTFNILRGEEKKSIHIKPGKRPSGTRPVVPAAESDQDLEKQMRAWLAEQKRDIADPKRTKASPRKTYSPGALVPGTPIPARIAVGGQGGTMTWKTPDGGTHIHSMGVPAPARLPDDMQVTITKKGNKPATVTAKQGKKVWKTTENELDMLPPAAAAYAGRMLGKDVLTKRGAWGYIPNAVAPGSAGAGGFSAVPMQHFELRLGENGEVQLESPKKERPQVDPKTGQWGLKLHLEEADKKQEGQEKQDPQPKRAIRWMELKRSEAVPEGKPEEEPKKEAESREQRVRHLHDLAEKLKAELEQLREAAREQQEK